MKRRAWTTVEVSTLRAMAERGEPGAVIAEALNRTHAAINCKAKELGIGLSYPCGGHHHNTKFPEELIAGIKALRAAGFDPIVIAQMMNRNWRISEAHVRGVCCGFWRNKEAA